MKEVLSIGLQRIRLRFLNELRERIGHSCSLRAKSKRIALIVWYSLKSGTSLNKLHLLLET
jgi:hypothetical protein